jgi:hypothetical protein
VPLGYKGTPNLDTCKNLRKITGRSLLMA